MDIALFIIGLVLFVGLVVLHEFGHAIAARRNKVDVEEFGIGFPPRAWSRKLKNGTLFSLNWLPLGGFVRLKGEHDAATGPGTYGGASLWVKTKILLAGVLVNWLTAVLIFTILALIGLPKVLPNQFTVAGDTQVSKGDVKIGLITKDSPAEKSGLRVGDTIVSFAGQPVDDAEELVERTAAEAGNTVALQVQREEVVEGVVYFHKEDITVTLNKDPGQVGYLGVVPQQEVTNRATWSAPIVGVGVTVQFTVETLHGLGKTIAKMFQAKFAEAGAQVAGPVGIFSILLSSSAAGVVPILFLIGVLSLTLAVMNVLPIPALDGGRLFVTLVFRLFGAKLTKKREETIQATGFAILLVIVVLVTIADVGRLFNK